MKTATFEIKVFKKGNYIYVVPTDSETEIEGFAKDVKIVRKSITSTDWAFYGFNSDVEIRDYEFSISLIKKENGDAYTNEEFKTWKEENTGIVSASARTDALLQQIVDNTSLANEHLELQSEVLDNVYQKEVQQTEDLESIKNNTTPPQPANNWNLEGTGELVIPANSQTSLTIIANEDVVFETLGVQQTIDAGQNRSFSFSTGLANEITIVSGDWDLIGIGIKPDYTPIPEFNFDITADWANIENYPVTDQASFELFLSERSYNNDNSLTDIVITDFSIVGNRLTCNLTVNCDTLGLAYIGLTEVIGVGILNSLNYLDLSYNQLTTFNPSVALPSSLQNLDLSSNQLTTFNPSVALPSSLQNLELSSNQLTTFNPSVALPSSLQNLELSYNQLTSASYAEAEAWANNQPSFINLCSIYTNGNINSGNGTNLDAILNTKNANILN